MKIIKLNPTDFYLICFGIIGVPATLNYIDLDKTPSGSPPLIPYPSLENNIAGDCANGLSTVYRIKADKCGRLWALDTGTVGIGNTTQNVCPYALNVYDLATDRRIRRYEFKAEDTNPNTFIASIAIDIGKNCEDAFAYFSDELGYGLISYSWELNKSWRFAHSYFYPDPLRGAFNIAGLAFEWFEEGIFGMALSPMKSDGYRTMYFSPLASHREFSVSTQILRDSTRLEESYHDFSFFKEEREGNAHTTSRVMSEDGVLLFNLVDQNSIGCWNSASEYSPKNHGIIDRDDETMVFPSDVKIDETNTVWALSDRMPVFLLAELDYTDINFRIFSAPLDSLLANTVCNVGRTLSRFSPISVLPASPPLRQSTFQPTTFQPTTYQYIDAPTSALSNGYQQTTQKFLSYTNTPSTVPSSPKAFIFNQHNGVTYKTESPAYYNFYPGHGLGNNYRRQHNGGQNLGDQSAEQSGEHYHKKSNDWHSQFFY